MRRRVRARDCPEAAGDMEPYQRHCSSGQNARFAVLISTLLSRSRAAGPEGCWADRQQCRDRLLILVIGSLRLRTYPESVRGLQVLLVLRRKLKVQVKDQGVLQFRQKHHHAVLSHRLTRSWSRNTFAMICA